MKIDPLSLSRALPRRYTRLLLLGATLAALVCAVAAHFVPAAHDALLYASWVFVALALLSESLGLLPRLLRPAPTRD